ILDAIAEVHRGGAPMSSVIARKVVSTFRKPPSVQVPDNALSSREEDVLRLISKGYRTKEIARALDLKAGTINTYVRKIYRKLEVRSRAEAVAQLRKK
ncbi:MAG TPA: response regulator transcription factor, partial [Verrucomicrobiae bacterium]|nr:response regulator transcription factor [Verrucomicrobiae bacterium]